MPKDLWAKARAKDAAKRGRRAKQRPTPKRRKRGQDADAIYTIKPGTPCHVRKPGTAAWRAHVTRLPVVCRGFIWRNERTYGLLHEGWEIKVALGRFLANGKIVTR